VRNRMAFRRSDLSVPVWSEILEMTAFVVENSMEHERCSDKIYVGSKTNLTRCRFLLRKGQPDCDKFSIQLG